MTSEGSHGTAPSRTPPAARPEGEATPMERWSAVPLYQQLFEILREEIVSGRLKADQRVATEFELMGTFVGRGKIEPELSALTGFVEDMQALGLTASAKVLGVENVKAPERVAESLAVPRGELVTKITRIRLAEAVPVSFEYSFLPLELGRRVSEENLEVSPIFSLFEDKYGIALGEALYRIEAARATRAVALALEIERGAPVLAIERTTYSTAGRPVDFEQMFYRGDRIRYSMRLKRRRPGA